MGQRFRLRSDFDVSTFSPANQVILRALKKYGMMLADNGSAWFMSGVPDDRWDNTDLAKLKTVLGSNLEAVDESSLMIDANLGQARQSGGAPPPPVISALSPSPLSVGSFSLTVTGSGFQSGAIVTFGGTPLATTFNSATHLTATGTASSPSSAVAVTVTNPDGGVSNKVYVAVVSSAVTVVVSPASAKVKDRQTKQFSATVQNSADHTVAWKVTGVTGGNATIGTISAGGLYRAPNSVPSPATVTITATSVAAPGASGNASVTIVRH